MSSPISITPISEVILSSSGATVVNTNYDVGTQDAPLIYQSIAVGNPIDTGGGGGTPGECPELSWQLFPRR